MTFEIGIHTKRFAKDCVVWATTDEALIEDRVDGLDELRRLRKDIGKLLDDIDSEIARLEVNP